MLCFSDYDSLLAHDIKENNKLVWTVSVELLMLTLHVLFTLLY